LDTPLSISLPPKETKAAEKRRPKPSQFELGSSLRFPSNGSSMDSFNDRSRSRLNSMFMSNSSSVAAAFVNAFKCVAENQQLKNSPLFLSTNNQAKPFDSSPDLLSGLFDAHRSVDEDIKSRGASKFCAWLFGGYGLKWLVINAVFLLIFGTFKRFI
jgi:hypothetical protein